MTTDANKERWIEEATSVIKGWDHVFDIYVQSSAMLGLQKSVATARYIEGLLNKIERLEQELEGNI